MCGAPNEDTATYCANCGAALNPEMPPVEPVRAEEAVPPEEPAWPEESVPAAVLPPELTVPPPPQRPAYVPPVPPPPGPVGRAVPAAPVSAPVNGMAVASLVLGIAGLTVLPLIASAFALIFGYMARREIRQRPDETSGHGVAVAGIVLGWIGIGLLIVGLVLGGVMLCGICGWFGSSGMQ
jgi:hypothetical protein